MNCQLIKDIIKVPQDRLLCPTHVNNKKNQVFENFLFKRVTRPDFSGVPFIGQFVFIILIKNRLINTYIFKAIYTDKIYNNLIITLN